MRKTIIAILIIASAAAAARAGELAPMERVALLVEADKAFQDAVNSENDWEAEANYRKAINAWERLADDGIRNGRLHYNLANTYFRLGEPALAILHYRRALRLMPGDSRIISNLRFARTRLHDKIDVSGKRALARSLFFWHYDTSLKARSISALVFYVLVWVLLAAVIFLRRRALRWMLAGAVAVTIALAASCLVSGLMRSDEGVVTAEQVTIRKGSGLSYEPKYEAGLHSGAEFTVIERRGTGRNCWLHIKLADGKAGWIPASACEII